MEHSRDEALTQVVGQDLSGDGPYAVVAKRSRYREEGIPLYDAVRIDRHHHLAAGAAEALMESGSYPSGHTTLGWMWALILAEIAPERINAILSRGLAFGESRVVCNVHWESDVTAGRILGAGVVARLHADAAFRKDLEAAKAEFAAIRAKGLKPRRDCAAEAAALGK